MIKERPILFSGPMVRATLRTADPKTQTRRLVKPEPDGIEETFDSGYPYRISNDGNATNVPISCPYGKPGDRLWGRETWVELIAVSPASDSPIEIGEGERLIEPPTSWIDGEGRKRWHYDGRVIAYRAHSKIEFCDGDGFTGEHADKSDMPRWRPSIHMPRWASRILLEIVSVRVERLQDISGPDAIAEGIDMTGAPFDGTRGELANWAIGKFRQLWTEINGPGSRDLNPYVWVITFTRITP